MASALLYLECRTCNEHILLAKAGSAESWDFGWKEGAEGILHGLYGEAFTERLNRFAKDHLHQSETQGSFQLFVKPPH